MGSAILQWPFSRFWQQFPTRIRRNGRRRKNTQRTRGKQLLINFKKKSQIVLKLSPELSQKLSLMSLKLSSKNSTKFDGMEKDERIPNELKTFKLFGLVLTQPKSSKVFITNHIPRFDFIFFHISKPYKFEVFWEGHKNLIKIALGWLFKCLWPSQNIHRHSAYS